MEYRVPTFNKFELSILGDDEDPFDVLKEQEAENAKLKAAEKNKKDVKATKSAKGKPNKKPLDTQPDSKSQKQNDSNVSRKDG